MPEPVREGTARGAASKSPKAPRPAPDAPAADEDVIHGSEQFLAVLGHLGRQGGTIRIGSGVDLELPSIVVSLAAAERMQIVAEPGGVRPRLHLRPAPLPGMSPTEWLALLSLRSGSLRLQGLDLVLSDPEGLPADRLAAIAVLPGTELILDDCTITVAVRAASAAVIAVQPAAISSEPRAASDAGVADAVVEVRDGFLRSGGDAVVVAGGGRLALKLEDVMVATEGSLLHALGGARAAAAGAPGKPALGVRIDRICARVKGGLVHLQTTREEPEPATVDIRADNSILNTVTGDHPLFRLEGQDQLERLRDRIRWIGRKIAYHRIKIYRRDEIVQVGGLPRIYDRDDWKRAFDPTDDAPMLTDLRFRQQADASVPAWKVVRDDLSLASGIAAGSLGPDADKIPDPPSSDTEF
jgi:serine/threonine-protein kinase